MCKGLPLGGRMVEVLVVAALVVAGPVVVVLAIFIVRSTSIQHKPETPSRVPKDASWKLLSAECSAPRTRPARCQLRAAAGPAVCPRPPARCAPLSAEACEG